MMDLAGFENVVGDDRYPELTIDSIKSINPEIILLSSEPFPFKDQDKTEIESQLENTRVIKVDGEMFSWYGSRLLLSPAYMIALREVLEKVV
jgi:ABC-type Fe3+-hydroxamate transport system substrate-binding protein